MKASVVIAAHNEARVIGRCVDALLAGSEPGELDITVVANGCDDDTAAVAAARPGVRVLTLVEPSKPAALNAGDEVAIGFPRFYLDADMTLTGDDIRALAAAATAPGALAATARRVVDLAGCPVLVRAYHSINAKLPVFRGTLFGRGVAVVSEAGRARFTHFPDQVADDLFLDSLFDRDEKREVASVVSRVAAPRRTRDLVRRLARVRSGNRDLRAAAPGARPAARSSWLRDVVLPRPWLLPAALCYVGIVAAAELRARQGVGWAADQSTR